MFISKILKFSEIEETLFENSLQIFPKLEDTYRSELFREPNKWIKDDENRKKRMYKILINELAYFIKLNDYIEVDVLEIRLIKIIEETNVSVSSFNKLLENKLNLLLEKMKNKICNLNDLYSTLEPQE